MQVVKITEGHGTPVSSGVKFTADTLQHEFDYYIAQKLLKSLLDEGLISEGEFNKITEKNRKSFSPYLAEIMPQMT